MTLEQRLVMLEAAVANIIGLLRAGEFRETPIDDPNDLEPRLRDNAWEKMSGCMAHGNTMCSDVRCLLPPERMKCNTCGHPEQFESDMRNHKAGHNMPDRASEWDEFLNAMAREEYPRYAAQRILEERKK